MKYKAFITYSHADEFWAAWLQRSLERYRVPKKVRMAHTDRQDNPFRLHPIFRDREELASSANLSESIRAALDESEALIVICSRAAVGSLWMTEEIRYFQETNRQNRILCLLVDGEPERGHPDCAFPKALLESSTGEILPEPLAADIRDSADGKRNAMLKIAAGLLGVGIDDLKQRDAQRQLRRLTSIAAGSLLVALITISLALLAVLARNEADVRRKQAEGLIDFMLGDLRSKLEPLGRLEVLDAVGDEAMAYFSAFDGRGTEQEIQARAMAVRQIGEVRFRRGQLESAQLAFEESRDIISALFESAPDNLVYLFELGQAEFWVGYAAMEQSDLQSTSESFSRYMDYSEQLLAAEPENLDYQLELVYALGNLGALALDRAEPQRALAYFERGLAGNLDLVDANPEDNYFRFELGGGYSWLGATHLYLGDLAQSREAYQEAIDVLRLPQESNEDKIYSQHYGENLYHLANVHLAEGERQQAESLLNASLTLFDELVTHDPENAVWRSDRGICRYYLAELYAVSARQAAAIEMLSAAIGDFEQSIAIDPGDKRVLENISLAESLLALLTYEDSRTNTLDLSRSAYQRISTLTNEETMKPRTIFNAALVMQRYGKMLQGQVNPEAALPIWSEALSLLDSRIDYGLAGLALKRQLLNLLRQDQSAEIIRTQLQTQFYNDPRFE